MTSCYPMQFTFLEDAPIESGVIRGQIDDFVVTEQALGEPQGHGEHVYLRIRKRNANTHWVAQQVARFCDIRPLDVGYAGRKDRHAVTEQWFSCYLPGTEPVWADLAIEGVEVLEVTRHSRKLRKGDLMGNHFVIQIRQVSDSPGLCGRLERLADTGFPNYFGSQRFGHNASNLVAADEFLSRRQRRHPRRDMLISAVRSYLFNRYLSDCLLAHDVPEFGPLYGLSRDPQPGEDRLSDQGTRWVEGLRRLRLKIGERRMIVKPTSLEWRFDDAGLRLSFMLPGGSFATSLIRELINAEDARAFSGPRRAMRVQFEH